MEEIKNILNKVGSTSKKILKSSKTYLKISKKEDEMQKKYIEIGKKVCDIYAYGGSLGDGFEEKYNEVAEIRSQISKLKAQSEEEKLNN